MQKAPQPIQKAPQPSATLQTPQPPPEQYLGENPVHDTIWLWFCQGARRPEEQKRFDALVQKGYITMALNELRRHRDFNRTYPEKAIPLNSWELIFLETHENAPRTPAK